MVEERPRAVRAPRVEHLQQEALHRLEAARVAAVLREVVREVAAGGAARQLRLEQVGLVEEEDDGDAAERPVVDDRLEDVARLDEPVRPPVLEQHLGRRGLKTDYSTSGGEG